MTNQKKTVDKECAKLARDLYRLHINGYARFSEELSSRISNLIQEERKQEREKVRKVIMGREKIGIARERASRTAEDLIERGAYSKGIKDTLGDLEKLK